MMKFKTGFIAFWFLGLILFRCPVLAGDFASPSVNVSHSTNDLLNVLESHDLIRIRHRGIRPHTRLQVSLWIAEAQTHFLERQNQFSESQARYVESILKKLSKDFSDELLRAKNNKHDKKILLKLWPEVRHDLTVLQNSARPYFQIPGTTYQPLVNHSGGRHFTDGFQTSFETVHQANFTRYVSAHLNPRLQFQAKKFGEQNIFLQEGYASFALLNHQIDAGRKELVLGQGSQGGVVLTNQARPLDMLQLQNMNPWQIPYLGSFKYLFFLADLGPEQLFSHSLLSGVKLSLSPHPVVELAVTRALIFGGKNAPFGSFSDMFLEYLGVRPGDINLVNLSNSLLGFEARVKIPFLRNLEVFSEFYFDDLNTSHPIRTLIQDSGILFGIHSAALDRKRSWFVDVEMQKHSSILYKHGVWTTGWTLNGKLLGLPLGADAESLSIHVKKILDPEFILSGSIHLERVDSDVYGGGSPQGRVKVVDGTAEYRYRFLAGGEKRFLPFLKTQGQLGYEYVRNFNFTSSQSKNGFLATVNLIWDTAYFVKGR